MATLIERLVEALEAEHATAWEDLVHRLDKLVSRGLTPEAVAAINAAVSYLGIGVEVSYVHDSFDAKPFGEQAIIEEIHDAALRNTARKTFHE